MPSTPPSTSPPATVSEYQPPPLLSPRATSMSNESKLLEDALSAVKVLESRFDTYRADVDARFDTFRKEVLGRLTEVETAPVASNAAVRDELRVVRRLMTQKALEIGEFRLESRDERVNRILETCRPHAEDGAEAHQTDLWPQRAAGTRPATAPVMTGGNSGNTEYRELFKTLGHRRTLVVSNAEPFADAWCDSSPKQSSLPRTRSRYRALVTPYKRATPSIPRVTKVRRKNLQVQYERDQVYPRGIQSSQTSSALPRLMALAAPSFTISKSKSSSDIEPQLQYYHSSLTAECKVASQTATNWTDDTQCLKAAESDLSVSRDSSQLLSEREPETDKEEMLTSIVLPDLL
ncbi:hypothetical protein CONPUDRAFT_76922 [Coniophora puteana RWD-64-598 SS2]|uniref:Uncharacterized protein n=1 Tax=Coniophora puteana (strain RWD-64-598) TaxID=741705 RepID=A0A5M3MAQ6_CONPW|nr:uncharacterized protein CONPUDRAFT_76922 [Coniophora puteana RWD-64-598 SS2]EIW75870.1 hypothetical protein CONPUDRAFT_76922 [Coniophora puteana RWD-64-598 SS2]